MVVYFYVVLTIEYYSLGIIEVLKSLCLGGMAELMTFGLMFVFRVFVPLF